LELLFSGPLVIIDPVDKGRNVASAVQPQKLHEFVAASREFLKSPQENFFNPPKTKALEARALKSAFEKQGSAFVFVSFDVHATVTVVLKVDH
jgi:tRNA nucleotidyltransferase (CCA-adding enzyme)